MVRLILAGFLVSCAVVVAPAAAAPPETCPPTCDRIPAAAWPAAESLPLYEVLHWPPLAELALPVLKPRFYTEELCSIPLPADDPRGYVVAARTTVPAPPGQWQLTAQILHWRGETWRGGQLVTEAFDQARAALHTCQEAAPQYSPSLTIDRADRIAAVMTGPQLIRQYLVAHPQSSSIAELVFSVTPPIGGSTAPWPASADAVLLESMVVALCEAYLSSCG
ncbi:MAG: ATPase [Mycobacterium sp.]